MASTCVLDASAVVRLILLDPAAADWAQTLETIGLVLAPELMLTEVTKAAGASATGFAVRCRGRQIPGHPPTQQRAAIAAWRQSGEAVGELEVASWRDRSTGREVSFG